MPLVIFRLFSLEHSFTSVGQLSVVVLYIREYIISKYITPYLFNGILLATPLIYNKTNKG